MVAWHLDIASAIVRDEQGFDTARQAFNWVHDLKFDHNPVDYLEDQGWVRLHGFGGLRPVWVAEYYSLTEEQRSVVEDWCLENGRSLDDALTG